MTQPSIDPLVGDPQLSTDQPQYKHIVRAGNGPRSAEVSVLDAMLNGTPVTALCGHVFVPSRDPKSLPPCPVCKRIRGQISDNAGLN